MYIGNGTPNNRMVKVGMAAGQETEWVEKIGKFRFGTTYNTTTKTLKMFHDGILVATATDVDHADAPLANIASYDQFLAEVYSSLDPASYGLAILQIPLDVLQSEIRFDAGEPFVAISNIRVFDECAQDFQMKTL